MKREWLSFFTLVLLAVSTVLAVLWITEKRANLTQEVAVTPAEPAATQPVSKEVPSVKALKSTIALPKPKLTGNVSVEEALQSRRSRREFAEQPVTLQELSQLVWSAQGVTDDKGHRTSPSGHGVYPYTIYVVVRNVTGLQPGLYQYLPEKHELGDLGLANAGEMLTSAEVQQGAQTAPVVIVLSAAVGKMVEQYPNDPVGPTLMEGGHIGQNIYLQMEALKMAGVVMAGFDSQKVVSALGLHPSEKIVYLVPVGHRAPEKPAQE